MFTAEAFCSAPPRTTASSCRMDHLVCGDEEGVRVQYLIIATGVDKVRHALSAVQCRIRSELGPAKSMPSDKINLTRFQAKSTPAARKQTTLV